MLYCFITHYYFIVPPYLSFSCAFVTVTVAQLEDLGFFEIFLLCHPVLSF